MRMNYLGKLNTKHGSFNFCHFDEYIGMALREYGEFSEIELSLMEKFIMKGDVVLDIGANIGCFTVPFSKKVGNKGKVLAFEPQKFIYELLKKNIDCNEIKNTTIFNNAVGKNHKSFELEEFDYSKLGNFGGIGLGENYDNSGIASTKNSKKYKIKTLTLHDFLYLKKCNFIKIDVELMEMEVLKGGIDFINKFRPIMWIENHSYYPNQINKFLLSNNYNSYWAPTRVYNPGNYFINDANHYKEIITINTIAIPKELNKKYVLEGFDKVTNPYSKWTKIFTKTFK